VAQELTAAEKLAGEAAARKAAERAEGEQKAALERVRRDGEEEVRRLKGASEKSLSTAQQQVQVQPHVRNPPASSI